MADRRADERSGWTTALPAALLAVALYAVTLRGTFVWDDRFIAEDDPRLHDVAGWRAYFHEAYRPGAVDNLWRPLTSLSFWLQWRVGGAAWALHAVNIALHAGASAMVALLTRRLAGSAAAGIAAGLLFATHPVHVESVAYLVGRAESLCALGALTSLYLFARRPLTSGRAVAVYACATAAALAKEQGLLVPVLLAAVAWCFPRSETPAPAPTGERHSTLLLVMLIVWTWAAYILYRDRILPWFWDPYFLDPAINPLARAVGLDRLLIPIALIGRCAALLVAPVTLSPDYGAAVITTQQSPSDPYLYLGFATLIAWSAAFVWAWRRRAGFTLFWLLGTAVAWALASNFIRIGTIFGERLAYLPSAFVLMGVGRWMVTRLRPRLAVAGVIMITVLFSLRTVTYARRWNDRDVLFTAALAEQPRSALLRVLRVETLQERARAATARGDQREARSAYAESDRLLVDGRRIVPDYYKIWVQSAETSLGLGRLDEANAFARKAVDLAPENPTGRYWLERVTQARAASTSRPSTGPVR